MNKSDSERIATILENKRYQPAKDERQADLIVLNICSVRQSAVDRAYNKVKHLSDLRGRSAHKRAKRVQCRRKKQSFSRASQKLKIIITGCILEKDKERFAKYGEIIKFSNLFKVKPKLKYDEGFTLLNAAKRQFCQRQNYLTGLIPIMEGCNNFCTYCVVPYTRNREQYRKESEIINEAKILIKKGYQKLLLLGQNVNSFPNFPELLQKINNLPGDFKISFLTSHPKDFSNKLIEVMARLEKIIKHLNLPVQSGNDEILKKMNRPYTIKQYKDLVKKIRKKMPEIKLSTDIIVGFPGETKKQFDNTVKLFKELNFDMAYISKYSPRSGTPAFKMKDNVSLEEKKRREKILRDLLKTEVNKSVDLCLQQLQQKLIVVLGSTGSGKTELAVKIAKKFNGEIVSADSRQIYCEMNIGTAKPTQKEMGGIPHHLIDIISPNKIFNVVNYRKLAIKIIKDIQKRDKIPILCGGTGFYIQAVVDGLIIPEVKPDWKLRDKLEKKSTEELFKQLKKLDPERAKTIEIKNKRRLIRAIEIITKTKKPIPKTDKIPLPYAVLILGIKLSKQEVEKKISKRVEKMINAGLEKEVKNLNKKYGWVPALETIGYQEWKEYFENKITKKEVKDLIILHTKQFAKRQMTWFKRDNKIKWIKKYSEIEKIIKMNIK